MAERLGVAPAPGGARVALPAPGATALWFCLFEGAREVERIPLAPVAEGLFAADLPGLAPGARYGLRAAGPWAPAAGARFNPAKLLLDPWARALDHAIALHPALFDTGARPDAADSAPHLPRCVWPGAVPPPAWAPLPPGPRIIYELQVRAFTRRHPAVPEAERGTFAALAHPAVLGHLARLGVSAVELLPCAAWVDERHLPPLGLSNAWGYNPVCPLAPDPRLAPGGMAEVRAAVQALRQAGIAVILDVVLNHTGEGDALGPTLNLRGLVPPRPQRERLRQRPRLRPALGAAARHGRAAPLGTGGRGGRLPPRPRANPRAARPGRRLRRERAAARRDPPRPGARDALDHRRALGPRGPSSGRLPPGLGRVERPLPRRHPALLARRCGHDRRAGHAPRRIERRAARPAGRQRELRHRA
jgi:hypothetical protein